MKTKFFVLALVLSFGFVGLMHAEENPQRLTKDDFDLHKKVDKLTHNVGTLEKKIDELNSKIDKLMAERAKANGVKTAEATEPVAPVAGTPTHAKPEGEGWTWDAEKNHWFRFLPTATAPAQSYVQPAYGAGAPGVGGFGFTFSAGFGGCANGRCGR